MLPSLNKVNLVYLFIFFLFLSRFVQRATGSPVYDCKVFYPSLNKVVSVIIVIVTVTVIVTIAIIIIKQDDFHRSYYLVFFTLFCWWRKVSARVFATT